VFIKATRFDPRGSYLGQIHVQNT